MLQRTLLMLALLAAIAAAQDGALGPNVTRVPIPAIGDDPEMVAFSVRSDGIDAEAANAVESFRLLRFPMRDGKPDTDSAETVTIRTSKALKDEDEGAGIVGYAIYIARSDWDPTRLYRLEPQREQGLGGVIVLWTPAAAAGDPGSPEGVRIVDTKGRTGLFSHEVRVDLRTAEGGGEELAAAIDYYLSLSTDLRTRAVQANDANRRFRERRLQFAFTSKGYVLTPDNGGGLDSVVNTLKFVREAVSVPLQASERNPNRDPFALLLDLHVKHETDQRFEDYQVAFGFGATASFALPRVFDRKIPLGVAFLAPILLTNRDALTGAIQQPWFGVSIDGIAKADQTDRAAITGDDSYVRIMLETSWTSQVIRPNMWLYYQVAVWIEFDAPDAVEAADRDINHFVEIGLKIPLRDSEKMWVVVKYVTGRLPPNFTEDSQIGVGFSIDF